MREKGKRREGMNEEDEEGKVRGEGINEGEIEGKGTHERDDIE